MAYYLIIPIAEMQRENYIRVGGFLPITPPPSPMKSQQVVSGLSHRPQPPTPTRKSVAKPLAIAQFIQDLICNAKL